MKAYLLDDVRRLAAHLSERRELLSPEQGPAGDVAWRALEEPWPLDVTALPRKPLSSPKGLFFPESEALFRFDGRHFVETLPEVRERALFGVTACDLTAISCLDRFFAEDVHYQARRRATLLVGIDCAAPCSGGFCPTVDAGPAVREGHADLVLHRVDVATPLLLLVMSEAGAEALAGLDLRAAPSDWQKQRKSNEAAVCAQFPDDAHLRAGIARVRSGGVPAQTFRELSLRCFACSGCTTVCPTCSCFAPHEQPLPALGPKAFSRARVWDSCLYDGFQREASGHNPSGSSAARVERFWYHKLSRDFEASLGRLGCVGCGRCETACLGAIGVHSVTRRLSQP